MALEPKKLVVTQEEKIDKILPKSLKRQKYQCLAQLGPCSTKYCDATCCSRTCLNYYSGLNAVAYCERIPGLAVRLCSCYHDCFQH